MLFQKRRTQHRVRTRILMASLMAFFSLTPPRRGYAENLMGSTPAQTSLPPILFETPDASDVDYRARLQTSRSLISPTQAYLQLNPRTEARDRLIRQFTSAQKSFLSGPVSEAKDKFAAIAQLLFSEDWKDASRSVILVSLLRLAQIESDPERQEHWLDQALTLGEATLQSLERSLFPPPLIDRLKRKRLATPPVRPSSILDTKEWSAILVNGSVCTRQNCPEIFAAPSVAVRVTFLSDKWLPQTAQIKIGDLPRLSPARERWVAGDCMHPEFHRLAHEFPDRQAFFNLDCRGADIPSAAEDSLKLSPIPDETDDRPNNRELFPVQASSRLAAPIPNTKSGTGNGKWYWLAATGIVAGTLTYLILAADHGHGSQRNEEKSTPTTVFGY